MINFIIYEDKEVIRKNYVKIIDKFMGGNDVSYKIYQFSKAFPLHLAFARRSSPFIRT